MKNQFDIKEHKWLDDSVHLVDYNDARLAIMLKIGSLSLALTKDDATAIAKHFYNRMTDKQQHDFFHTMNDEAQSETDYEEIGLCHKPPKSERVVPKDFYTFGESKLEFEYTGQGRPFKRMPKSETDYLNSTPANKQRLEESIDQLEHPASGVSMSSSRLKSIQESASEIGEIKHNG